MTTPRFVLLSGCSGGGKSTLIGELARRDYAIVEEPGRRIVRDEIAGGGRALPWIDLAGFARAALDLALDDYERHLETKGPVFFDRGIVDAAVALRHATGAPLDARVRSRRYATMVFLVPPWPEIHVTDRERPHGLATAIEEYDRLLRAFPELGYEVRILPKTSVPARLDLMLADLGLS